MAMLNNQMVYRIAAQLVDHCGKPKTNGLLFCLLASTLSDSWLS